MYVDLILYSDRNVIPTNNKYRNNIYVYALFEGRGNWFILWFKILS